MANPTEGVPEEKGAETLPLDELDFDAEGEDAFKTQEITAEPPVETDPAIIDAAREPGNPTVVTADLTRKTEAKPQSVLVKVSNLAKSLASFAGWRAEKATGVRIISRENLAAKFEDRMKKFMAEGTDEAKKKMGAIARAIDELITLDKKGPEEREKSKERRQELVRQLDGVKMVRMVADASKKAREKWIAKVEPKVREELNMTIAANEAIFKAVESFKASKGADDAEGLLEAINDELGAEGVPDNFKEGDEAKTNKFFRKILEQTAKELENENFLARQKPPQVKDEKKIAAIRAVIAKIPVEEAGV